MWKIDDASFVVIVNTPEFTVGTCLAVRACIMKKNLGLLGLLIAPLLGGCWVSESDDSSSSPSNSSNGTNATYGQEQSLSVQTSDMEASMSAQSDGTTVKVYAAVFDRTTANSIMLSQGDFFTVDTGSGDPLVLVLEPSTGEDPTEHYTASFPASTSAQDVTIGLVRQNFGSSAPNSILHIPAPFTVTFTGSEPVPLGNAINLQVAPVLTGDVEVEATGSCLDPAEGSYDPNTFDDALVFDSNGNGQFSSALLAVDDASTNDCNVAFYVSAISDGSLDPNFAGGASGVHDAEGVQTRMFDATISGLLSN